MSPVRGVGIDLVDVDRFERAIEARPGLLKRLFADSELEACERSARPARHLAARFCAKEAAVKALDLRGVPLRELVVSGGFGIRPAISVPGAGNLSVSLTHERSMAAAVVIAG